MKRKLLNPKQLIALLLMAVLLISAAPVSFAQSFSAYVSPASMPVYSSAAMTNKIGTLPVYSVVKVLDFNGDLGAPVKISYNGKTGYALPRYMQAIDSDNEATIIANTKVYLVYGNANSGVSVPAGTKVNVFATKGSVAAVERDGVGGFISTKLLSYEGNWSPEDFTGAATPTPAPTAAPAATAAPDPSKFIPATVTKKVNVYAGKTASTKYLGTMQKGWQVNVVETGDYWACVERNGAYGYCDITALTPTSQLATPTPAPTATAAPDPEKFIPATVTKKVNVYAGKTASTKYLGTMQKGWQVNVVETGDYWAYVERNGAYGYCDITALTPTSQLATPTPAPTATAAPDPEKFIPATVTKKVNVYAGKTASTKYLGTMQKGWQVNVVETGDYWAYVERNGAYGYCDITALTPTAQLTTPTPAPESGLEEAVPATVIVSSVKVYAQKSTSSKVLGTMRKGWEIKLVDFDDTWAYVERNGAYGYCSIAAIMPALPADEAISATITADSLKFYAAPSTSAKYLGSLKKGVKVNVLNMLDGWAFVERSGNYAWCEMSGLALAGAEEGEKDPLDGWKMETFTATVVGSGTKIYADASTSAESLNVPMGTNVTVIAYKLPWAAVVISDDLVGYMQVEDLSRESYAEMQSGMSIGEVATLEKALLAMGYFDDVPDTMYNAYTAEAVKLFQAACGMSQTGVADLATLRVLYGGKAPVCGLLNDVYAKGDTGAYVKRIQMRLFCLDYLSKSSSVDGDYGTNTYNAVKLFQAANGLEANGAVNSTTLKKLYSTSAAKLPSGKKAADAINVVSPSTGSQTNNSTSISSTLKSTTSTYSSSMTGPQKAEYLIYVGQNQLGKPYVYGATGTSSFDCSGFTWYCFKQVGVTLPRTAYSQGYNKNYDKVTSISDLERGAIVYFNTVSDSDSCDHAGIYLGAGWFIHASSGQGKVVVSNLSSGYYNGVFSWGHNVL